VVIITLTSVGYGDITPDSNFGKMTCIMVAIFGAFNTSLMVVTLQNTTKIQGAENEAYELLVRLKIKEKLQKKAVGVLEMAYLYKQQRKALGDDNCFKIKV